MLPDFIIIGAMKCGTSTLAAQLGAQPGIFMTTPKEPNFFSDDTVYARGLAWYADLFSAAAPDDLKGEASTHYTKLPTYPDCLPRMAETLDAPKLIYLVRNPIGRAVSHYIHDWTMGVIHTDIDTAIDRHSELVDYGCYGKQIAPFAEHYGTEQILVTSLEAMKTDPQATLQRVCAFLGHEPAVQWQNDLDRVNASSDRVRRFPMHDFLIDHPVSRRLRHLLVPKSVRARIRQRRQIATRPTLSEARTAQLQHIFREDYSILQALFPNRADIALAYPFLPDA